MNEIAPEIGLPSQDLPSFPKTAKSKWLPGDPQTPISLRIYGSIIVAVSTTWMIMIMGGIIASAGTMHGEPGALLMGVLMVAYSFLHYRIGRGLGNGERMAVYGLCIAGVLSPCLGLQSLIFLLLIYVLPIVATFRHWNTLK